MYHLGLIGSYTSYNNAVVEGYELGAGYYTTFGHKKRGVFEIYGCYGHANGGDENTHGTLNRIFIQPDIGYRNKVIDVILSTRICNLRYNLIASNGSPYSSSYAPQNSTNYGFIEPAITFRVGYKFAKFQLQYINSLSMRHNEWSHSENILCAGVFFSFEYLYKYFL